MKFGDLLTALRDSLIGARAATSRQSSRGSAPRITELTLRLEGVLYESASGLALRLDRRRLQGRRGLLHLEIRMHGHDPIITEMSIDGQSIDRTFAGTHPPEKDHEAHEQTTFFRRRRDSHS
jgi:hypothetical protein